MIGTIDSYAPCYCGSGKKYRFCCMNRYNLLLKNNIDIKLSPEDEKRSIQLFNEGYDLLGQSKFTEAIPRFEETIKINPYNFSATNNLALCHLHLGNVALARQVLQRYHQGAITPNIFGIALLSQIYYMEGNDAAALNTAFIAANMHNQNEYSVTKVCESLAHLRQHKAILDFVDQLFIKTNEETAFFAGVAAANLGNPQRAIEELESISMKNSGISTDLALKYLKLLQGNKSPNTPYGDWPYFSPQSYFFGNEENRDIFQKAIQNSGWLTDLVECYLIEFPKKSTVLTGLRDNKHPSAAKLLKAVVNWSEASKDVVFTAGSILSQEGLASDDEVAKMLSQSGKIADSNHDLQVVNMKIDWDFRYAEEYFPKAEEERYTQFIHNMHNPKADLNHQLTEIRYLESLAPDFYPFKFNEAVVLYNSGKIAEMEAILQKLAKEHPDYPFAFSGLINLYLHQQKLDEAEKIINSFTYPKIMHPDAGAALFSSFAQYYIAKGDLKVAKSHLDMAKNLNPDNRSYQEAQAVYEKAKVISSFMKKMSSSLKKGKKKK